MEKKTPIHHEPEALSRAGSVAHRKGRNVEETVTFLDELGPERIASIQRRAADLPEVLGEAPPPTRKKAR